MVLVGTLIRARGPVVGIPSVPFRFTRRDAMAASGFKRGELVLFLPKPALRWCFSRP